ncbi:ABC transporter ATP-binding protein [Truepera radiovictrix]|uniref:ABC transporter related protein n=1 Tax=Truepera radiovictrix (strain DSM 17093 / CIP 108686 / LMG 22925 / RQ-24) TaxID=649638 RepID=D7CU44_TRURR|nr:ABC transporter ATP-binding protein [Truepera radiovictrix]ADI13942.1 ABC transporter related protein [Truepera radiovictrix DSM 17093]WMT57494.1 ABC transporter ATP-binding protein [Truepera radiovictrix]
MLQLQGVGYAYRLNGRQVRVLQGVTHTFERGSFSSLRAPSGSGKTTLLNLLGLLDTPTEGRYLVEGRDTRHLTDAQKSSLRARTFGFLFQNFRLIPTRTVLENVTLALDISAQGPKRAQREAALRALEQVGLAGRAEHVPPELSGGEAQRVAFARALVRQPEVLLADEPTGNLDAANRDRLLDLISAFHARGGTVVMVTHDDVAAARATHPLRLEALMPAAATPLPVARAAARG